MSKMMSMVAVLMLALVLAACGGAAPAGNTPATGDTPEAVAKAFVEATFSGNIEAAKGQVCAAMAAALSGDTAGALGAMSGAEVDFSGVTYTASDVTDTSATVTVGGVMKVTVSGATQEMNFADMGPAAAFPLTKENGAWKVCQATPS